MPAMADTLVPGDVLLYRASGFYGRLIALKTWHPISHVEVYAGDGQSEASRDGVGVGRYLLRTDGLTHVLRPVHPAFNWASGDAWFRAVEGQPYGWLDLLQFVGLPVNGPGMVCSPFVAGRLRASGLPIFNAEPIEKIAPCTFLLSELLVDVTDPALLGG